MVWRVIPVACLKTTFKSKISSTNKPELGPVFAQKLENDVGLDANKQLQTREHKPKRTGHWSKA
jgi:hypothetical protein